MINPERVEAIIKLPWAITKKQLRGFLRAVGFYQQWIPGSEELTKPLTEATRRRTYKVGPGERESL